MAKKHISGINSSSGAMNCKGYLTHITRPIRSMSRSGNAGQFGNNSKFDQRKWQKRMRRYWKDESRTYSIIDKNI